MPFPFPWYFPIKISSFLAAHEIFQSVSAYLRSIWPFYTESLFPSCNASLEMYKKNALYKHNTIVLIEDDRTRGATSIEKNIFQLIQLRAKRIQWFACRQPILITVEIRFSLLMSYHYHCSSFRENSRKPIRHITTYRLPPAPALWKRSKHTYSSCSTI